MVQVELKSPPRYRCSYLCYTWEDVEDNVMMNTRRAYIGGRQFCARVIIMCI